MPELVIRLERAVGLTAAALQPSSSLRAAPFSDFHQFLVSENLTVAPFRRRHRRQLAFGPGFATASTEQVEPSTATVLDSFLYIRHHPVDRLRSLRSQVAKIAGVVAAYVKPDAEIQRPESSADSAPARTGDLATSSGQARNPDFSALQSYFGDSPGGLEILKHQHLPGADGTDVTIVDVEGDWNLDHEALRGRVDPSLRSTPGADWQDDQDIWNNHGTAVLGLLAASSTNGFQGFAPKARLGIQSVFSTTPNALTTGEAIVTAAEDLSPGDIVVLELHRPGPRYGFVATSDQRGNIPVEWWEDDFAAIKHVCDKGIIVLEAGGNGQENLDAAIYDAYSGFTAEWQNPFRRNADSGAIIVGAGAPPNSPGRLDRERLPFSNYGAVIDAQGWGERVTTGGYGDLQGGGDRNRWYTGRFDGTSSALPMVAGVLACAQGILRKAGVPLLTPATAREGLRSTGSPQQWSPGTPATDRIGNRPVLSALLAAAGMPLG